eukprot:8150264-Lingulodinium_polyedra.AAC.1
MVLRWASRANLPALARQTPATAGCAPTPRLLRGNQPGLSHPRNCLRFAASASFAQRASG